MISPQLLCKISIQSTLSYLWSVFTNSSHIVLNNWVLKKYRNTEIDIKPKTHGAPWNDMKQLPYLAPQINWGSRKAKVNLLSSTSVILFCFFGAFILFFLQKWDTNWNIGPRRQSMWKWKSPKMWKTCIVCFNK